MLLRVSHDGHESEQRTLQLSIQEMLSVSFGSGNCCHDPPAVGRSEEQSLQKAWTLRRLLALMHQRKTDRGLYMQLNDATPIMLLYGNPDICLKRDFCLNQTTVAYLIQLITSPSDHGWGQEMEVLVFLYSLAHGLSLSVVSSAFGIPRTTVHNMIHRVSRDIKAKLSTVISLPSPQELHTIAQGFSELARSPAFAHAAGAIDGWHIRIRAPGNLHCADKLFSIHTNAGHMKRKRQILGCVCGLSRLCT
ncbi:uncharacterized protein LOC121902352 isoform X2 [Thunnus maccoyii]|uniref:uncharacterized protein LOC121902352 isoform X2 n=1 Tax=Thunnus maccoyii TaxID=8240 RepID=UPI001C4ABB5E|nr:uncharacterized protein LOC121902352 isoform X2 [Thunnus maccoyii]